MKPTIGRIVHFQESGALRAAVVALVNDDDTLNLTVFAADGTTFARQSVTAAPAEAFAKIDDDDKNAAAKRAEQRAQREQRWTWPARV